jgi:hypothetical protein
MIASFIPPAERASITAVLPPVEAKKHIIKYLAARAATHRDVRSGHVHLRTVDDVRAFSLYVRHPSFTPSMTLWITDSATKPEILTAMSEVLAQCQLSLCIAINPCPTFTYPADDFIATLHRFSSCCAALRVHGPIPLAQLKGCLSWPKLPPPTCDTLILHTDILAAEGLTGWLNHSQVKYLTLKGAASTRHWCRLLQQVILPSIKMFRAEHGIPEDCLAVFASHHPTLRNIHVEGGLQSCLCCDKHIGSNTFPLDLSSIDAPLPLIIRVLTHMIPSLSISMINVHPGPRILRAKRSAVAMFFVEALRRHLSICSLSFQHAPGGTSALELAPHIQYGTLPHITKLSVSTHRKRLDIVCIHPLSNMI